MRSPKRVRKRKPKESSAQIIASNDDLLPELLLCLPIKSLLKFKCVCKQWLALITDPNFTRQKHLKSSAISAIFSKVADFRYELVPLRPLKRRDPLMSLTLVDRQRISIISSCKGLLLCESSIWSKTVSKYYIYNPTTRQFRALPHPFGQDTDIELIGFCLAFDPPKSHAYKVVCIHRRLPHSCNVYSSETGLWRVSGPRLELPRGTEFDYAAYCNGAIHWVCEHQPTLCVDLEKEVAREIPLPLRDSAGGGNNIVYFGESGGHLHLIYSSFVAKFPVYEMERDSDRWFVKFRVDLNGVVPSSPHIHQGVLCVARGEKEGDGFLVMHVPRKVIRYNFETNTHEVIYNTNNPRSKECKVIRCNFSRQTYEVKNSKTYAVTMSSGWPFVHQYIESFSPV